MRSRCSDKNVRCYVNYGGRGIKVCERWNIFENFYADMGPRLSPKHSLERKDNNKDYSPDNCVWALTLVQQNNKRNTFFVVYRGERMGLGQALRLSGSLLQHSTVFRRIRVNNWSVDDAITTPLLRPSRRQNAKTDHHQA